MSNIKVGGEVDAHCTKCKMVLAHTVLAVWADQIKRVRCNTCMGEHAFRAAAAAPKPKAPRAKAVSKRAGVDKTVVSASGYEAMVAGKDRANARRYDAKETFKSGELVEHPAFGLGVVAGVRGDKVDLAFQAGVKTLQHMKGTGPAVLARPLAPKVLTGQSDKVPQPEEAQLPEAVGSAQR